METKTYDALFGMYEGELVAGGHPDAGDVGGVHFLGLLMGQNQHALVAFDTLFKQLEREGVPAQRIIELGTSHGGLSIFLRLYSLARSIAFTTYDYYGFEPQYRELFELLQIDYRQGDVLFDRATVDGIGASLGEPGTSVLLCDNGNKALEFTAYSRFLKPGDIILAHDYSHDDEVFNTVMYQRLWSYVELRHSDLADACAEHGLVAYLESSFTPAAWACYRKSAGSGAS